MSWSASGSTEEAPYIFENKGWPVGDDPSFEEDLASSEGWGDEVGECIDFIAQLKRDDWSGMERIRRHAPKLYGRITSEDPPQIIPDRDSGMTAGSLRYVIKHLTGTIEAPNNGNRSAASEFLKWVAQISITIWEYQCDKDVFGDLLQSMGKFVFDIHFAPSENAAAYLAVISFALAGDLNDKLAEYVDAVVWNSKFELASSMEPLRTMINSQWLYRVPC